VALQKDLGEATAAKAAAIATGEVQQAEMQQTLDLAMKYQHELGKTTCVDCAHGRFGRPGSTGGTSLESYCATCPHGKYQPNQGSSQCVHCLAGKKGKHGEHGAVLEGTHCRVCAAGQYQDVTAQTQCKGCSRIDDLRHQWAPEGSTSCADVSLDCKPSQWSSWGTCSKSCMPMVGKLKNLKGEAGTQTRTRTPEQQLPCALANTAQCNQAWGGGKECATFAWSESQKCNEDGLCPVDCETSKWSAWSPCTKQCKGGVSTRTRIVAISNANGGTICPHLAESSVCNEAVSCSKWDLPTCQPDHVHCDLKHHNLHEARAWKSGIDSHGKRYYHNTVNGMNTYSKPKDFIECGAMPATKFVATGKRALAKRDTGSNVFGAEHQWTHERTGSFQAHVDQDCYNNQNCGLVDIGRCHDCDTEQECKDLGVSTTVFVTHHRKNMDAQGVWNHATGKRERLQHFCRRDGEAGCKCVCNGHTPCMSRRGMMITNEMLHANIFHNIPTLQDCCNMCTNHPECGSWEYSDTHICVLKRGAPKFAAQPSGGFVMWSGCRAGETC
jgi:hypothetical protein